MTAICKKQETVRSLVRRSDAVFLENGILHGHIAACSECIDAFVDEFALRSVQEGRPEIPEWVPEFLRREIVLARKEWAVGLGEEFD